MVVCTYAKRLEKVLGLLVDVELAALAVLGEVESGHLWNVLILPLTLLFLQLEGDTADWASLDTLHQVCGVAGNLYTTRQYPVLLCPLCCVCPPCCADACWR